MNIVNGDLSHPAVKALLAEHMRGMVEHSPPGSIHSLDLAGLRSPNISFWTAWADQDLLGCAALKELDTSHGEIKSMRTRWKPFRPLIGPVTCANWLTPRADLL